MKSNIQHNINNQFKQIARQYHKPTAVRLHLMYHLRFIISLIPLVKCVRQYVLPTHSFILSTFVEVHHITSA